MRNRTIRVLGRLARPLVWLAAVSPVLALSPAAVLDRSPAPGVTTRVSLFPLALAALDPYVWECLRNSLGVAAVATALSGLIGLGLACGWVRRRLWGRGPIVVLAGIGLAVPPAVSALGLRFALRAVGGGGLPHDGSLPGSLVGWGVWVWSAAVWASPLAALAAAAGLRRIDPVWEDAARIAGLSRRVAWHRLVWPHVRPPLARMLGLVFGLTLLDPGPALILGLRRTLGYQIVQSAQDSGSPGQLTRAVVLAGFGTLLAFAGRFLLGGWGGREPERMSAEPPPEPRPTRAGWSRTLAGLAFPLGLTVLTWLPLVALVRASLSGQVGWTLSAFAGVFQDLLTRQALAGSAVLCVSAACLDLVVARVLGRLTRSRPRLSRLTSALLGVPPLAVGVGALAIPGLLTMAAEGAERLSGPATFAATAAEALRAIGDVLDPDRSPGVLLVLGVAAVRLRALWKTAEDRLRREHPAPREAAELLGLSQRTARRLARGGWPLPSPASVLAGVLAATSLTPALVLAPTAETRPVGPSLVDLADRPGDAPARAAALAVGVVLLNAAGYAAASRAKGGPKRLDPGG